jgi:hypothetical protein
LPALDDDALSALWSVYDATGIRPEYLIPVLYFESAGTFSPAIQNLAGGAYYGLAQTSGDKLAALGTTPAAFLAMSQGDQIRTAVIPYFSGVVKRFGPIASATRAYQANFEPATLATAKSLGSILEPRGTRAYADNAHALDTFRHSAITVGDLAVVMSRAADAAPVRAATARAYALRPSLAPARPPVYGEDFLSPAATLALFALALFGASRL